MTKTLPILLLLAATASACGGVGDLKSISDSPDGLEGATLCGWVWKYDKDLGLTDKTGDCWYIAPPQDISVMPTGSRPCDADEGVTPAVWADGDQVSLYARFGSSGSPKVRWTEVACR